MNAVIKVQMITYDLSVDSYMFWHWSAVGRESLQARMPRRTHHSKH